MLAEVGGEGEAYRWLCIYFLKLKLLKENFQVYNDYK